MSKRGAFKTTRQRALPPFVRRVSVLAGGTALGQLVIAVSSPLITRLYSPEDVGLLAVFISILAPILALASFRYDVAIVLPRQDSTAIQLVYLSLCLVMVSALFAASALLVIGPELASSLKVPQLKGYLWLLPVSIVGGGFFQTLSYWGIRKKSFKTIGQARLLQSVVLVLTQITLGVLSVVPSGLFAGDALSRGFGTSRLAREALKHAADLGPPCSRSLRNVAHRYRRFPQFSVGPAVLNTLSLQLPALILSYQFGATPVGMFAIGQRILGGPLSMVSTAVGQVFLGDTAEAAHVAPESLANRFIRAARVLAIVGAAVVVPVAATAPWLFRSVFGDDWQTAGRYLQFLAPMFIMQFVSSPMGSILDVLERQDLHVYREIIRMTLMLCAWQVWLTKSSEADTLVAFLSTAGAAGYAAGLVLVWKAIRDSRDPRRRNGSG